MPIAVALHRRDRAAAREYATNLSASGLCLHLRAPLPVGEPVRVVFALPHDSAAIEARGRVSWAETPDAEASPRFFEAGVRFEVVADADRERLARFVRACEPAEPPSPDASRS